ncbi:MAG: hypothetical protein WAM14_04345 [Candidatus Nitrosopolaris sp.]
MTASSNIKGFPDSNPICKKVIRVGDQPSAMVVVLHESIVKQLHIDEECWFEEIPTSEGILLKISSKKIESFRSSGSV